MFRFFAMNIKNAISYTLLFLISFQPISAQREVNTASLETYLKEQNIEAEKTDYGLYYQITEQGNGPNPQTGDYLVLHFQGKLLDGTVFETSDPADPFIFQVGYRQVIRGWDLGLKIFPVGSKGTLFIPPNLGYGTRGAGQMVPPNAPLIFDMEVLKIMSQEEYNAYMTTLEKKEKAAYEAQIKEQFINDKKRIQEYALSRKLRTKRTDSGLSYSIIKKGKGANARAGDLLEVAYEGFLIDGKPFDATKGAETYTFTLGRGKVIEGWEEGLTYFSEGSEGYLLIPSKLAYGPRPIHEKEVSIPANSVLIFKIKVKRIQRAEGS